MATQADIGRAVGLDVSSVSKILARQPGPVFKKATIEKVFRVAKKLGYKLDRETKHSLRAERAELKKALADVYARYHAMGGRTLDPQTFVTVEKLFLQLAGRGKVASG